MKPLHFLVFSLLFSCNTKAQPKSAEEHLILDFLSYVKSPEWNIDTVDKKYIVDYPTDTASGSKDTRQKWLKLQVIDLKNQLKEIDLNAVKMIPYSLAPENLRILRLSDEWADRSYIVTDSKSFTRYILLKGDQIEAFAFWQKSYWLLD